MTYYTNADDRSQLIGGLRELAAFLDSNPDVPAPPDATAFVFPSADLSDEDRRSEIDAIAAHLNTQARKTAGGHYVASRFFGPVEYRAVALPRETNNGWDGE